MKINFPVNEFVTSLILIVILAAFLAPTHLLMPMDFDKMLVVLLIILFLSFSAVIWKENSLDERENLHRLNAGRLSFLVGSGLLVVAIILQSLKHHIDPWLIYILIAMVLTKVASRIYSNFKQ